MTERNDVQLSLLGQLTATHLSSRRDRSPASLTRSPTLDCPTAELSGADQRAGLVMPPGFTAWIGTSLTFTPSARFTLWYLRQASNFPATAARVRNQWRFRHSAWNLPLKASVSALFVGLPGLMKSRVPVRWQALRSISRDTNSLSCLERTVLD